MSFAVPTPWADPIEDYLAAGYEHVGDWDFFRGIHDLAVYDDRLYLGHGDANVNLGRVIPIGFRYFASDDDPTAENEFDSDEEQLERYRVIDGDLFMAGVDATEDAWLGNVYYRGPQSGWVKSRTLDEGVHVHDIVGFRGQHYAVGSGSSEEEWGNGDIYAHLWRSRDGGASFDITWRVHNGGTGDARWVRLLPSANALYLFGYTSNSLGRIDNLIGATYGEATCGSCKRSVQLFADDHPLRWVFVTETDVIGPPESVEALGIVRGIDLTEDPLRYATWTLGAAGQVELLTALDGMTLLDVVEHEPTGETLLLLCDGDDYEQSFELTEWQVRIWVTSTFADFVELVSFHTAVPPRSLAYWRGQLFYGTDHGQVWRAASE